MLLQKASCFELLLRPRIRWESLRRSPRPPSRLGRGISPPHTTPPQHLQRLETRRLRRLAASPPHHTGFTLKYHPGCEYGFNIVNVFFRFCSLNDRVLFRVCLGPLLFLIHINDLVTVYNTNVTPKLYADDSKLYACLSCLDFQQNLDRLTEWTNTW